MEIRFQKSILMLLSLICMSINAFSQKEVSVNPSKGLLNVNIPFYSFNMIDFNVDVGYNYVGRGVKPANTSSSKDGWFFFGAGTIKRVLRGLPDEKIWSSGDGRYGWKGGALYSVPPVLSPADDGDPNNCADEQTNYTNINNNFNSNTDYEPDLFVVEAPGLNFTMMFDNQGNLKPLNALDVKLEFIGSTYFVITNSKGIKYTFSLRGSVNKQVTSFGTPLNLFMTQRNYFTTSLIYTDMWYLTKIEANTSGGYVRLDYQYQIDNSRSVSEDQNVLIKNYAADTARSSKLYTLAHNSGSRKYIKSITSSLGSKIEMPLEADRPITFNIFNSLKPGKPADRIISIGLSGPPISITETLSNGSSKTLYTFSYYDPFYASPWLNQPNKTDAWGYMNGSSGTTATPKIYVYPAFAGTTGVYRPYPIPGYSGTSYTLPGNDKAANENYTAYGALKSILYPNGGQSSFEYESNSFMDQDAGAEVKGAGIRIKAINHFDGLNTSTVMRKEYSYKNDLNQTSGTINVLPTYAISTPSYKDIISNVTKSYATVVSDYGINSMNYWNSLTIRTDFDLYHGESQVSYSQVTITQPGNGKIKQIYSTPKSFWDLSDKPASYPAEICNSGNGTFINKAYYQYPFAPLGNSARCDLLKEYTYNENGDLVKKLEYEYEDFNPTPVKIYGLAIDDNMGIKQISKYGIDINSSLLKQTKETIYDNNLNGNGLLTQTDYDNSAFARNVRSIKTTNSDNSESKTSFIYSGDFETVSMPEVTSNQDLQAVVLLNGQNNRDEVLEKTYTVKPSGTGSFLTFGSQANIFAKNTSTPTNLPILKEVRVLKNINGLSDFTPMSVSGTSPYKSLSTDSRYKSVKLFENYNKYNQPAKVTEQRKFSTMIPDTTLHAPMLKVQGAELTNILFSNFDRIDTARNLKPQYTATVYANDGYFGRSVVIKDGNSLINNFTRKAEDKFYKLAFLAKAQSSTQVSISIYNGPTTYVSTSITINPSSEYQYYEKEINLTSCNGGFLLVGSPGEVQLDNIIFFPVNAQFNAYNYSNTFTKVAEIGSNGVGQYYDYDVYGLLMATKDLKKNVVSAKFYNAEGTGITPSCIDFIFVNSANNIAGLKSKFRVVVGSYIPGAKYSWNFGDGSTLDSYDNEVTHVFSSAGTYTVSVSVSHPEFSSHPDFVVNTWNTSITIRAASSIFASMCASGITKLNPCYDIYKYSNCSGYPPGNVDSPDGTIFYAYSGGCTGSTPAKYIWEYSYDGVEFFQYYLMNDYQTDLRINKYEYYGMDLYFRCRVIFDDCEVERVTNTVHIINDCSIF